MKMLIPLLVLLMASVSFAVITVESISPMNDTFVVNGGGGLGYNGSAGARHGNETFLVTSDGSIQSQFELPENIQALMKINNSLINDKIITQVNASFFDFGLTGTCGNSFGDQIIRWINNDTWADSINFTEKAAYLQKLNLTTWASQANASEAKSGNFNLTQKEVMADLYDDNFTTFFINSKNGKCNGAGAWAQFDSIEGSNPPLFFFTLADYESSSGTFTFGGSRTAYFDFESRAGSFSDFPEADFSFNIDTNTLTPLHSIEARETTSEYDIVNNLNSQTCSAVTNYGTAGISSINFPSGNYWNICFKLSAQHNGQSFYGAVKVINNTNNLFTFYWALYSPSYVTFSSFLASPASPRGTQDAVITWSTTQATRGYLRTFYAYGINSTSPIATVNDLNYPNLSTEHIALIPSVNAFSSYYIKLFGDAADNTTYATENYELAFTSGSDIGVPSVEDYFDNINYSDAVVVIPMNAVGYPVGLQLSCNWISPSGSETGYQSATVQYLAESQQITAAAWVLFLGQSNIGETWNISCKSDGFYAMTNLSILVDALPKVIQLEMGDAPRCDAVLYTPSQTDCGINMNASAENAWYCRFDASRCSTFNVNGSCLQYGTWIGYGCDSCAVIPTGFTCNATAGIGQQVNGTVSISSGIGESVGGFFGVNSAGGLAFLAMIMSIILTFAAGILTKNGIVTGIVFVGGLVMFFFVGWLPVWIPIIMGVIAAFMVAKFIVSAASPQGSGD